MSSHIARFCAFSALLLVQSAAAAEDVEAALADDEECARPELGVEGRCALNALQKRIAKVGGDQEEVAGSETETASSGHPTLKLELFRAMRKTDLKHGFANVDMGTVGGVINYLHTDVGWLKSQPIGSTSKVSLACLSESVQAPRLEEVHHHVVPLRKVLAFSALLLVQPAAAAEDVEAALADDEECAQPEIGVEGRCALNALQKRIAKVGGDQEEVAGSETETASSGHPTLKLELFRAMRKTDLKHGFANVDMGTVGGVINYLHTDVVGEHVGDYNGYKPLIGSESRINGVEVVVGVNAHVRNPDSAISAVGHHVDFARSAHFIEGEATGPAYNWNFGDIVGVQKGADRRWPFAEPYYRFSLSGFCPNLKFPQKRSGAIKAARLFREQEAGELSAGGRRRRRHVGVCMTYSNQFNQPFGKVLKGGLCPNGTEPGRMPTGAPGCVYTYERPTREAVVELDDLVGITKEDCGGRLCRDWQDFRNHCTNRRYHRQFNYKSRRRYSTVLRSHKCVEYDIHKACAKSCSSPACRQVSPHKRELGLPFWHGRCSAHMNAQRAERLAAAFGIYSAGKAHQLQRSPNGETCLSSTSSLCHPDAKTGGKYCTRLWGGVCQPCYVPGANATYLKAKTTPMCPWSIFRYTGDYHSANSKPVCSSNLPEDLCCLYTSTCNTTLTSDPLPLTDDGFAYVSSKQDTKAMVAFLERAAYDAFAANVTDAEKLERIAYWQWGLSPIPGKTLEKVMKLVKHYLI
eukprot:CAMPEP_0204610200 /NCGR_PEP_ID=MMETSP0661-20131031/61378_1 /ASSEMBLY_ACC=CAM_ASM_000606 /TAXON_ID=109239 /ORGANISM="Alexandrium margalefi, Strain AMGDE01CS-322" /LENGTH=747 /DNA_ID=CAMNT_0051622003 /DNA_START=77 /DNA_END=2321 /DNA_ORIENTATION=+